MLEEALADAMQRILVLLLVEYNPLNSMYCGGLFAGEVIPDTVVPWIRNSRSPSAHGVTFTHRY